MTQNQSPGKRGLSPDAYRVMDGKDYRPYVSPRDVLPEFTLRAIILGSILGIIFGAANAYLGLKVGMTVTASIPVSVISMGILRGLMRRGTVLENNIVQTVGSAGESIAAGVIFTIPALLLMGLSPSLGTLFAVAALGGMLGVLLMIPLRRYLIVREHGALPYPEGTGCAEVLVAGEEGGSKFKTVFAGLGLGALYKVLMDPYVIGLWKEEPHVQLPILKKGVVGFDSYPALLGVGFIIGPRIAALMMAGGALAWLGLIPLIAWIGDMLPAPLYPSEVPISEMSAGDIWNRYIRYIGAGAVALGGIVSLIRAIPTIVSSFGASLKGFRLRVNPDEPRSSRDLPGSLVLGGSIFVALVIWLLPALEVNLLGAILIVLFTFFFASVASRVVGLVGGSSLPVSGMTIASLLGTALIFSALGWTGMEGKVAVLIVGAVICVGISAAGDISQDLKTGFLVGATPYRQQAGQFIGVLTAATVIGAVVLLLHAAFGIGSQALPAPQATLMKLVVEGVMDKNLPWAFVLAGVVIAGIVELLGIHSLPFAVGLYLPFSLSVPIMAGGILRGVTEKRFSDKRLKSARENGVLFGSGLVAGEATIGVLIALLVYSREKIAWLSSIPAPIIGKLPYPGLVSLAAFSVMMFILWSKVTGNHKKDVDEYQVDRKPPSPRRNWIVPLLFVIGVVLLFGWQQGRKKGWIDKESFRATQAEVLIRRGETQAARDLLTMDGEVPADSASLWHWAGSYESDGNWLEAATSWRKAVELQPGIVEFKLHYWQSLSAYAGDDTTLSDSIQALIRKGGDDFSLGGSLDSMEVAYTAALIVGDTIAEPRADRIIDTYPESQLAINLVGGRFWDGLYPIWRDNEGRIKYLTEFIKRYSGFSWRNRAWQSLIGTYAEVGDTAAMVSEAARWVASSPNDPAVLSTAAAYMLDKGGDADYARTWTQQAWQQRFNLRQPPHMPDEEWQLYEQSARASIPRRMAEVKLRDGEVKAAAEFALKSLDLADYGVDEEATRAPQFYLLGMIALAENDSNKAADYWIKALVEGDVRDYYSGLADSSLKAVFGFDNRAKLLDFCRDSSRYEGITFTNVTQELGLEDARGSRVSWGDYDGDGDDDLLTGGINLFRNDNSVFVNVSEQTGLIARGIHGGVWGDYDNDGWLDLFCFSSSADSNLAERLYHNRGDGTFEDVTDKAGNIRDENSTEAAIWGDFNGDGRLDMLIPGYERPYGSASELGRGWEDRLLIQDSNSVFHDRTQEYGMIPPLGKHLCGRSPVACDFDRDGDQDVYVGNYRLQQNLFWINDNSHYINRAAWYMIDGEQVDGWWGHTIGCQWGDFDGDGDFDLISANLAHPRYIRFSNRTMLYHNDGTGKEFTDVRRDWGIRYDECHSEPLWGDLDNDGDIDLYITCVYPNRRSYLYRNDGNKFTDVTFLSGTRIFNGWGCALSDYDNDGDLDLAVCEGGKVELFRNDTECENWLEIKIIGSETAKLSAVGTIVESTAGEKHQIRQVEGGKGAGSQSSMVVHFGLGEDESTSITVFTDGRKGITQDYEANQKLECNLDEVDLTIQSGNGSD